jgi:hypothetical protein
MGGVHMLEQKGIRMCTPPGFSPFFVQGSETLAEPWRSTALNEDAQGRERFTYLGVREDPLVALKAQVPDASADFAPSVYYETSVPDGEGNTALHHAVKQGDYDAVKACLKMGADLHQPNGAGVTPLDMCADDEFRYKVLLLDKKRKFCFAAYHGHLDDLMGFVKPQACAELLRYGRPNTSDAQLSAQARRTQLQRETGLLSRDAEKRSAAIGLGRQGDQGGAEYATDVARLLNIAEPTQVILAALEALPKLGRAGAAFAFLVADLVEHPDYTVRHAAALSLAALGRAGVAGPAAGEVAELLTDEHEDIVASAANALSAAGAPLAHGAAAGLHGGSNAGASTVPLLADSDPHVRIAAASALGMLKTESFAPMIAELLQDEDERVKKAAAQALHELGKDSAYPSAAPLLTAVGSQGYSVGWTPCTDEECGEAVFAALAGGHIHCAKPLIYCMEPGFNAMWTNEDGRNYVHALAMCRPMTTHKCYNVERGKEVESPGYGWTHEAKMLDLCRHLVAERANIHVRDKDLRSPLFVAAMENNATVTAILIENEADPNCWDKERRKPLHVAVMRGNDEPAKILIPKTYTLARDRFGCNPLPLAAFRKGLCKEDTKVALSVQMQEDKDKMPISETQVWAECLKWSRTWNVRRLRYWVEVASVSCIRSQADQDLLDIYIEDVRDLAPMCEAVYPVCLRGSVTVEYDSCEIVIEKEIPFEARKPPDTSAEFVAGTEEAVREIIEDLAVVVKAFRSPMVVEGHTGATDPADYWGELAQNRANKIVDILYEFGCAPDKVKPLGCPGGGAKVIVRPAKKKK